MADYDSTVKLLSTMKYTFFTHPVKDNRKFKLVLFGLPQIGIDNIKEEFKSRHNIEPVSIKEIKTARSNSNDALFIVEFNRSQISKREVRKIHYFYNISVKWRNPLRGNKGPTQCSKCTMYGHGATHCHRKPACLGCGGDHDYSECSLEKLPSAGPVIYKCHNCLKNNRKNTNHKADDIRCPYRKEYLEIRQRVTAKHRPVSTRRQGASENYYIAEEFDDDVPSTSKNIREKLAQSQSSKRMPYASILKSKSQNEVSDDISNEKILEIFFDAIDALEKCRNKYDKMRVLGMMLKHVI